MRIVGGRHRGRKLAVPPGRDTRPTADRTRQALFNILEHGGFKPGGGSPLVGAVVLDAFAGTGALGLEALSRGAAHAVFMDNVRIALDTIRANVAACREDANATILRADATKPPFPTARTSERKPPPLVEGGRGRGTSSPAGDESDSSAQSSRTSTPALPHQGGGSEAAHIAFLDPPYHSALAAPALTALAKAGWLADGAICVVEVAANEDFIAPEGFKALDERRYGAAKVVLVGYRG